MEYEEMARDIVNVKVTSGDSKAEVKKSEMMKAEKNGNISTDIAAFQLERASFCSTRIINMDASRLFPVKTSPDISRRNEYDVPIGAYPPPSPRSRKDLHAPDQPVRLNYTEDTTRRANYHPRLSRRALGEPTTILPPLTNKDRNRFTDTKKVLDAKENKSIPSRYIGQTPTANQKDEVVDDARLANEMMLKTCDPNLNFHLTSLAKPNWPRSAPTIPCTFYKNLNEKNVEFNFDDMVKPAPVQKRPLEIIYNPYPTSCSKFCNHPIDRDLRQEYKDVIRKAKEGITANELYAMGYGNSHNTILLPDEEEQLVREELGRIANNANVRRDAHGTTSPLGDGGFGSDAGSSAADSLGRPDSLGPVDDDEDKIPEELLLKYVAKPDSPEHHYVPSGQFNRGLMNQKDRSSIEGFLPGQGGIPTSPRYAGSDTSPRARSRGRSITPDQLIHDENASKKKIVLDLRRTRSSENLLHGADSTDLGQSLFEMGKPSIDQDSMVGVNGLDSIQETKRQESVTQPEEALKIPVKEPEKEATDESKDADLVQASVSKSAADEDVSLTDKKEDDSKSKTSLASVPSKMELKQEKPPKSPSPKPGAKMTSGKSSPERKGGKKKKDKKKFARHKVRSDSPDKDFYETVGDPAETQVATSGRKPSQSSGPKRGGSRDGATAGGIDTVGGGENRDGDATTDDDDDGKINIDHDEVDGLRQEYFDDEDELNDADEDDKATDEKETPGEKGLNMKDNPLDRRALQSLEKQLSLEPPESKFDLSGVPQVLCIRGNPQGPGRLKEIDDRVIKEVRNAPGRSGNPSVVEAEIRQLQREHALPSKLNIEENEDADFWLQLPRTFSYQSARFELPLDMQVLHTMTPLDYLARYVSISSSRRQLYNKVYCRHRSLKDNMLNETTLLSSLEEVMGSTFSDKQKERFWNQMGIVLKAHVLNVFDYKQFCGMAAMAERLYCADFSRTGQDKYSQKESKSEIEVADFDRLLAKIEHVPMENPAMRELLIKLKESGLPSSDDLGQRGGRQILTRKTSRFEFL